MKLFILSVFSFLIVSCGLNSSNAESGYQIKFGYASTDDGKRFSFLKEAYLIPLVPMKQGIYYGLNIIPAHTNPYKISIKYYEPNNKELASDSYSGQGEMTIPMGFNDDDEPGIYKLEVNIDGNNEANISFEAILVELH